MLLLSVMKISELNRKKLIFFAFLLVDFFAAVETTSLAIAAPKIVEFFSFSENIISWIINSYLYPLFITLLMLLIFSKKIKEKVAAKKFFIEGIIYFFLGSIICYMSDQAALFFFGRALQGLGAGLAFVGQLWIITESYKREIAKPLMWTQIGFAVGIVIGPVLGGLFSELYPGGWSLIFLLNAIICLFIGALVILFYQKKGKYPDEDEKIEKDHKFSNSFKIIVLCEGIFSLIIIAIEFILSIYLQVDRNLSPLTTGIFILVASIGIITGSSWLAYRDQVNFARVLQVGFQALIVSIIIMGILMNFNLIPLLLFSLFIVGFIIGAISVASYAYVSQVIFSGTLVSGIILYLIAMYLGTAFGVEMENLWMTLNKDYLVVTLIMVILLQIALFLSFRLKKPESAIIN
jgi:MFS family permease